MPESLPLGDPGLLVGEWFQERKKKYRYGLVPHLTDITHNVVAEFRRSTPQSVVIDVSQDPAQVTRLISPSRTRRRSFLFYDS